MSFQFDIPGLSIVTNKLLGTEVKAAITDNMDRGLAAMDTGDTLEATQAFSQTAAVLLVFAIETIYLASDKAAIKGLGTVFASLTSNKGFVALFLEKYVTQLFPVYASQVELAKVRNWGTSTAAGYSVAWWTNTTINAINDLHLGARFYDLLHPACLAVRPPVTEYKAITTYGSYSYQTTVESDNDGDAATDAAEGETKTVYATGSYPIITYKRVLVSPADPIILDLAGNGIQTVGLNAGIQFDINGSGVKQGTGWIGAANDAVFEIRKRG
jgi:hypothetical protein